MSSKRRVGIAHFLLRTFEMLDTPKLKHLIEWSTCGEMFYIKNAREFANKVQSRFKFISQVLPQYFRHRNFQSFLRQLNMYNFVKKRLKNGWNQFQHKYFKREAKNLLIHVHRRSNGQQSDEEEQTSIFQSLLLDQQDSIKKQQEQLQQIKYLQNDIVLTSSLLYQQSVILQSNFQRLKNVLSFRLNQKLLYQYIEEQKQEKFLFNTFSLLNKSQSDSPKLTQTILTQNHKETDQEPQLFVLS
ncbi:unnamed protein product (macronuclear) [Paramecium tetraurelia]|uniref:HSF-type DNA-binding domain-containing protein n=1 Tax=Paramecium tetraurelia TaxID=5888 RepID=A0EDR5_PARTE|nr:uncharacterized protein GSPATT00025776001 [Paramecium tetraurelia]CAK93432.1 unnamed protein product [Paramecium tetraurelia]|eukprot:XP_001460829.1 hypothetical protein (macronuclear) [Paramecium tetraurelia strain d4-2]